MGLITLLIVVVIAVVLVVIAAKFVSGVFRTILGIVVAGIVIYAIAWMFGIDPITNALSALVTWVIP